MARTPKGAPPAYGRHPTSGQARVVVRDVLGDRHEIKLGTYGSPDSYRRYQEVLAKLAGHGGRWPLEGVIVAPTGPHVDSSAVPVPIASEGVTVSELLVAFFSDPVVKRERCEKELGQMKRTVAPLRRLYADHPAAKFSPKCLRALREAMLSGSWMTADEQKAQTKRGDPIGWCRGTVNRRIGRIQLIFSWGVAEELLPPGTSHALREVKGIRMGTTGVREAEPRRPAFWGDVEKAVPFCPEPVAAMLMLQCLTGMRSGEVRIMRPVDIDMSDPECWTYQPGSDAGPFGKHKNAWRGQMQFVPLGPKCMEILRPWLEGRGPGDYLFNPRAWRRKCDEARIAARTSKPTPRQLRAMRENREKAVPNTAYTSMSYPQAVRRACELAGVSFQPYALRHGRKMTLEREVGAEGARCVLGQKSIDSTQHYGNRDTAHAKDVMKKLG